MSHKTAERSGKSSLNRGGDCEEFCAIGSDRSWPSWEPALCCCLPCWSLRPSPRSAGSCPPRPRSKASRSRGPSRSSSPRHSSRWHRAGLPHLTRRQDRLARRLGRGGRQRPAVLARQSLDRLVPGGSRRDFGLWGGRFDRDCPAVGYYSSQVVLFGAEFTRVYAKHRGSPLEPKGNAVFTTRKKYA